MAINTRNIFELAARKAYLVDSDTSAIEMGDLLNILEKTGGGFVREYATENDLPVANDVDEKIRVAYVTDNTRLYLRNSSGWSGTTIDGNFNQVSLLLKTNGSITDVSNDANSLTLNGAVTQSSTQTKYATQSIFFNNGPYITTTLTNPPVKGQPWTIEGWVWKSSTTSTFDGFWQFGNYSAGLTLRLHNGASPGYYLFGNGGAQIFSNTAINFNDSTWRHVALSHDGTTFRIFIDGILEDDSTATGYTLGSDIIIGRYTTPTVYNFLGYVEDFRITTGLARYTANFTPPAEAFDGF